MIRIISLFILISSMIQGVFAQNLTIKGQVKNAQNKENLEFANVILQTTDSVFIQGTITNEKGEYSLEKFPSGNYQLQLSSLGFKTRYIPLNEVAEDRHLEVFFLEEDVISLESVTVSASNINSKSDRMLVHPSERQVKSSTNGINLLQQLMLPKVQVNPLFNEIKLPGGGEIQLRINGAKVEIQDIIALNPTEIIRIEYHDNPGLRYGNAEVVLDYIVHRPETGGNLGLDLNDAVAAAWGNNSINAKINHKKSEFSMNYGISHRDFYRMWRDNKERFTFEDGSILERKEVGEPGHGEMYWQNLNATYSLIEPEKRMFNATVRYHTNRTLHWDYHGQLFNQANPNDAVHMIDNSSNKTHRPAVDLYYQQQLKNDQTLVFNLVGTYNYTDETRFYQESREKLILTDINNLVKGNKYSVIGEGIYEKKLGNYRLSGGIRYNHSFSDNSYKNGHDYTTQMDQSEASAYIEFKGKQQNLDYTLGAGISRNWFSQKGQGDGYENYTFNPRIVLHYTLPGQSYIRLRGNISNSSPSLSNMSKVEQTIDSLQIQRGNPDLKPFMRYRTDLTYEIQKGIFHGNWMTGYDYQPDAIMDEKYREGNKIIQTWDNQRSWQRLESRLTLRVGPIKDLLQVAVTGGVNHYISKGNTYAHEYTNWYTNVSLSASYKKLMLAFNLETNWNWFYGETMSGGENIHILMLRYNHKNMAFTAGMFNPFADNYKQESENRSQYASYKRANYIKESSRLLLFQFSYNFSFGRSFKGGQKKINNSDDDSGVMSTGK
ncbi:TonB-dependent receptor [Parabacteroides sp. PF5-9]|uniref:TonB-dependent receptor n=1 Tax=Parabacteroides sp. PF5-9 TaxID=1742404 RepID=UPI0024768D75|nr:TonB-dependent receptor [Parabacteroides sp. PF5-9]MDH6359041.1 hypothetical protein [Parabacteroides sp. PF5-9]